MRASIRERNSKSIPTIISIFAPFFQIPCANIVDENLVGFLKEITPTFGAILPENEINYDFFVPFRFLFVHLHLYVFCPFSSDTSSQF